MNTNFWIANCRRAFAATAIAAASQIAWAAPVLDIERSGHMVEVQLWETGVLDLALGAGPHEATARQALQRLSAGDLPGAEVLALEAVRLAPRQAAAHELLATVRGLQGAQKAALLSLRKALELEPQRGSALTKLGTLLMIQGNLKGAADALGRAIALRPDDRFAHQRLGLVMLAQRNLPAAAQHLELGLRGVPPDYVGVKVDLARTYNLLGRFAEAAALLQPVAARGGAQDPYLLLVLGAAHLGLKDNASALTGFQRAATLAPPQAPFHVSLGVGLDAAGDAAGALKAFARAAQLDPQSPAAVFNHADSLVKAGRQAEAVTLLQNAAAKGVQPPTALLKAADITLASGDWRTAAKAYEALSKRPGAPRHTWTQWLQALQQGADTQAGILVADALVKTFAKDPVAHYEAGRFYAFARDYPRAGKALQDGLKLRPNDPQMLYALAAVHSRSGNPQAAVNTARQLVKQSPNHTAARFLLAGLLEESGKTQEAHSEYRQVLKREPAHAYALNNLANMLAREGQLDDALKLAQQAASAAPQDARVLDTRGTLEMRVGQPTQAMATLTRALSLAPELHLARFHLGQAQAAAGQPGPARESLKAAAAAQPEAPWAAEARRMADSLGK